MRQHDLRRLSMWWAVRQHLAAYKQTWNGNEPFSEASEQLEQAIGQARDALDVQALSSRGVTTDSILLKQEAINRTVAIARCTRAYARDVRNSELLSAVDYGRGPLLTMSHHELAAQLRTIINAARTQGEALRRFGVTPEDCDAALEAVVAMEGAQSFVRTAITSRKAVTMNVPAIIAAGRAALAKMDDLVHLFGQTDPKFVSGYKTARRIVHAASRSKDDPLAEAA